MTEAALPPAADEALPHDPGPDRQAPVSAASPASTAPGEPGAREQEVLNAAAALFAEKGYAATTVRDIGQRVGLQGGSLYHYIRSKEALFIKLHAVALQKAEDRIRAAIADEHDPAARLAVAVRLLLAIQLDPQSITMPLMNDFRAVPASVRQELIVKRDSFERLFKQLVADVPLPAGMDPGIYRLLLLTVLNNSSLWYRDGQAFSADAIADQVLRLFGQPDPAES